MTRTRTLPDITGETVDILVGQKTFHVHTAVLIRSSQFFKKTMKPEWRSDPSKPIDLSSEKSAHFEKYCQWLYSGSNLSSEMPECRHDELAHLYVFGEQIMDTSFQEAILTAVIDRSTSGTFPCDLAVQIIYQGTTAQSPARRLMVDFWAYNASPGWVEVKDLTASTCAEFVNDLVNALLQLRAKPTANVKRPWVARPESYRTSDSDRREGAAGGRETGEVTETVISEDIVVL